MTYMHNSDTFEEPLKFNEFRFAKLAEKERMDRVEDSENSWNVTTLTKANFG
jgi:hypothetical protein